MKHSAKTGGDELLAAVHARAGTSLKSRSSVASQQVSRVLRVLLIFLSLRGGGHNPS